MVTAGWLSSLLAISAVDLGDGSHLVHRRRTAWPGRGLPGAARLGGADPVADRLVLGRPAGLGGRRPTRAGRRSARSVAHAKLAAQEMRCRDGRGQAPGRCRHGSARAVGSGDQRVLDPAPRGPPYTATSLLLAGRYAEAAEMTRRIIDTAYRSRSPWDQPTN